MRILDQMIAAAEPGQPVAKFAEIAREGLSETSVHPIVGRSFGHAIGLDINEPPNFTLDEKTSLQSGNCYTLRFGISGEDSNAALVSAMIEITETGARLMGRLD